jgi:hypothetical protein
LVPVCLHGCGLNIMGVRVELFRLLCNVVFGEGVILDFLSCLTWSFWHGVCPLNLATTISDLRSLLSLLYFGHVNILNNLRIPDTAHKSLLVRASPPSAMMTVVIA